MMKGRKHRCLALTCPVRAYLASYRTSLNAAPVFYLPLGGKVQIWGTCATRDCVGGEITWRGDGIGGAKQAQGGAVNVEHLRKEQCQVSTA